MPNSQDDGWEDKNPTQKRLYAALRGAFDRADAAAQAVARLENDIAEEYRIYSADEMEDTADEEVTVRSAQESNRDFDDSSFNELFDKLNVIRLTSDLADILEVDPHTKAEIIGTLVATQFSREPVSNPRSVGKKTVVGDDLGVFLHNVKLEAARKQASQHRSS